MSMKQIGTVLGYFFALKFYECRLPISQFYTCIHIYVDIVLLYPFLNLRTDTKQYTEFKNLVSIYIYAYINSNLCLIFCMSDYYMNPPYRLSVNFG